MRKNTRTTHTLYSTRRATIIILSVFLLGCFAAITYTSASKTTVKPDGLSAGTDKSTSQKRKSGKPDKCPHCSPPGNQEIYIPLTELPESRGGEIVFNSRSPKEMEVTPTFYKLDGTTVVGDPVLVQSAEIRYVDFKKLIPAGHRDEQDWGGLSLSYYGVNREMWAQFRLLGINGGGNADEFFIVKDEPRSDIQEAAWWMPRRSTAVIALGNVTDSTTGATVTFGGGDVRTVSLPPHATEILRHEKERGEDTESVTINITGQPGSVIPTGVIESEDGSFNSVIRFYDTKGAKQPNLFANGLRLAGVTPHMVLKNTSSSAITAQPKFITPGGVGAAEPVVLPEINLGPNEITEVDLAPLLQAVGSRNDLDVVSVQVSNSGWPGSLIGSLYGINNSTGVNYDTPLRDSGPVRTMTGSYPWKITNDFTTVAYVTNISDRQAEFITEINYQGGKFILTPRKLQPGETAAFDLRKIRDGQMEDSAGHTLPKDVSLGQFKWAVHGVTGGKLVLIGRAEMASRSRRISTSYSCNDPCPPSYAADMDPFPAPVVVNDSTTATVWETAYYGTGYTVGPYATGATWTLDNAVATLDPTTDGHSTTLTGTTPGEANLDAFVSQQERYTWDGLECLDDGEEDETADGVETVSPKIDDIDPGRGLVGQSVNVTLTGSGFEDEFETIGQLTGDTGLTVSQVQGSDQRLTATIAIAANASAGNHTLTLTVSGQTATKTFVVQIPKKLVRQDFPSTYNPAQETTGVGPLQSGTDIDFKRLDGTVKASHQCGAYRNYLYQLEDQDGQPIVAEVTISESFPDNEVTGDTNFKRVSESASTNNVGYLGDLNGIGKPAGQCLTTATSTTQKQHFTATIGQQQYALTTVISITLGFNPSSNPQYTVSNSITTP